MRIALRERLDQRRDGDVEALFARRVGATVTCLGTAADLLIPFIQPGRKTRGEGKIITPFAVLGWARGRRSSRAWATLLLFLLFLFLALLTPFLRQVVLVTPATGAFALT
ncbi:MAG: hypothetical protein KC442_06235 [Thermomicrobiales bacterium]|nr:hypothetical protein [Thermomicrobiales bacterium]